MGKKATSSGKKVGAAARERLRQRFNREFADWEIELPADAMEHGVVWIIVQGGWTIWTRFDVEYGRERLDYYAMHRMTHDRHVRMYSDLEDATLPTMSEAYSYRQDATEAEKAEAEAEYYARNREVAKFLKEKGFVMTDQAHPSAALNRYLQTDSDA